MKTPQAPASLAWIEEFGFEPAVACSCDECLGRSPGDLGPSSAELIDSTFALGR